MFEEQDVKRVYRAAQSGYVSPEDVIALVNFWTATAFELDCTSVERDELRKLIEAEGYGIKGPSLRPTLYRMAQPAPSD